MKMTLNSTTRRLVLGGLLAACVLLLTLVVALPIPGLAGAYVNLGDAGVYLAAYLLGGPCGALCAGLGSALADLLLGSALYAGPTFLIKGMMAFFAGMLMQRWAGKRRFLSLLLAGLWLPVGYYLFECMLYGPLVALSGVPANIAQYAVGVALGRPLISIAEKLKRD